MSEVKIVTRGGFPSAEYLVTTAGGFGAKSLGASQSKRTAP